MDRRKPLTTTSTVQIARRLRREISPIERIVWAQLRAHRTDGMKFRRQHPIGRFVVDFYHHESRTVIELDGSSHGDQFNEDLVRQTWLHVNGYRVLRFTNSDVVTNLDGVIARIIEVCQRGSQSS